MSGNATVSQKVVAMKNQLLGTAQPGSLSKEPTMQVI